MARTLASSRLNVARLARAIRRGELVAVPTETVYGLAANALNPAACRAIFRAKGRPLTDPLIVHIRTMRELRSIAVVPAEAAALARVFWPGPLTLVLPRKPAVPDIVAAGGPTVAVRMPAHPVMRRLLRAAGTPLAAPSANPFGRLSPTTAAHVEAGLGDRIPWILDGGPCGVGVESTIVDLSNPERPCILRPGGISAAAISRALGRRVPIFHGAARASSAQKAPGMLKQHYSPRTPLLLHRKLTASRVRSGAADEAFLFFSKPSAAIAASHPHVFWLSERGSPAAAARRLFAVLHKLDAQGFATIHAELAPANDAGAAINDRLRRAAAKG
ncbi:MAG TPA: L-threonylcarbamoyladenylate synthase [Opitutaceae bacterium]